MFCPFFFWQILIKDVSVSKYEQMFERLNLRWVKIKKEKHERYYNIDILMNKLVVEMVWDWWHRARTWNQILLRKALASTWACYRNDNYDVWIRYKELLLVKSMKYSVDSTHGKWPSYTLRELNRYYGVTKTKQNGCYRIVNGKIGMDFVCSLNSDLYASDW